VSRRSLAVREGARKARKCGSGEKAKMVVVRKGELLEAE